MSDLDNLKKDLTMFKIKFISENSSAEFMKALGEYKDIWEKDGERIVKKFKEISGLDFIEKEITAIVFEGISNSGKVYVSPMKLRASLLKEEKKATLTHELGHRLLFQHNIKKNKELGEHQILDLILYDIWADLYGNEFSDGQVERESNRKNPKAPYKECWQWALSKNRNERSNFFKVITRQINNSCTS